MKSGVVVLCFVVILAGVVSAGDVAYVYRNERMVDKGFTSVFGDMGLSVDLINSKDIKTTDFSGYKLVFIGDERLRNLKYLPDVPMVVANRYYGKDLGLIERGRISKTASNMPLMVESGAEIQVYDRSSFKLGGRGIPYYYIPAKYQTGNAESVARTMKGYRTNVGDVVSYLPGKCFFGITKSEFWTAGARDLFVDCVSHVLVEGIHDVRIVDDYVNSVNGIRIKDLDSGDYLLDSVERLECGESYKVDFKTENVGEWMEDIAISGLVSDFDWSTTKKGLLAGKTTTAGSKTISLSDAGFYNLNVTVSIDKDATPLNNFASREVEVIC